MVITVPHRMILQHDWQVSGPSLLSDTGAARSQPFIAVLG
jgi:hypothetical protein